MPHFSIDVLTRNLMQLEPLELAGMSVLAQRRTTTGEILPTTLTPETRQPVIAATVELVAYTQRCRQMAHQLDRLHPIPMTEIPPCT